MAAANNQRTITLPPFWTDNAAGWFAHVESRFRAKGVMDEWDRFDHTVAALSKEIIQLCFHAVAHPDDDEPYSVLKEDLLQQHTLTKSRGSRGCWRSGHWAAAALHSYWRR